MPRYTLLEMTQDILSEGGGDYAASISDTEESEQVAALIRTAYWDIIEEKASDWEHLKDMVELDSSGESTKPTHMKLPTSVYKIWFLNYNKRDVSDTRDKFDKVTYLVPEEFMSMVNLRNETESNIDQVVDFSGIDINIYNDRAPTYYTSFDDTWFIFDSYDSEVDTTLQTSKSQCYVSKIPSWTHENSFVPDLPPQAFSLLLSEAKSVYWNSLKQLPNQKEEQRAARQRANLKQQSHQISRGEKPRKYGRRSRK